MLGLLWPWCSETPDASNPILARRLWRAHGLGRAFLDDECVLRELLAKVSVTVSGVGACVVASGAPDGFEPSKAFIFAVELGCDCLHRRVRSGATSFGEDTKIVTLRTRVLGMA